MKAYWRIFKPFSVGVRAILVNRSNQVLLVRHSYTDMWFLPGGGVHKKESLPNALARELQEELGVEMKEDISLLGTYSNFIEHKSDYVSVFVVKDFIINPRKNEEIEDRSFFDFENLPDAISPGTHRRIQEYLGVKSIDYKW